MKVVKVLFIIVIILSLGISAYIGFGLNDHEFSFAPTATPTMFVDATPTFVATTTPTAVPTEKPTEVPTPTPTPAPVTINLAVLGDLVMHMGMYDQGYDKAADTYDFSYILRDVKNILSDADYAMACIETTFNGTKDYQGYPYFISPERLAYNLKDAGISFLNTANNHSLDSGYAGIANTIKVLDQVGIEHTGTFDNQQDYEDPVVVVNINGISIAVVAMTYNTNWHKVQEAYAVNYFTLDWNREGLKPDYDRIDYCIAKAKEKKADLIAFYMHWGTEYDIKGNSMQKAVADYLFDHGVTLVLGGHAHVPQPLEYRTVTYGDGTTGTGVLSYCLGNFLSTMDYQYAYTTAALNITITKSYGGKATVQDVSYVPLYMYDAYDNKNWDGKYPRYQLVDAYRALDAYEAGDVSEYPYMNVTVVNNLHRTISELHKIMGEEFDYRCK